MSLRPRTAGFVPVATVSEPYSTYAVAAPVVKNDSVAASDLPQ
jgi:hypothetical protein